MCDPLLPVRITPPILLFGAVAELVPFADEARALVVMVVEDEPEPPPVEGGTTISEGSTGSTTGGVVVLRGGFSQQCAQCGNV